MPADVVAIMGTRPEAIKLAPVVRALRASGVATAIVATGQHRELLAGALADFNLAADLDLGVMRQDQQLPELTARLIEALPGALARLGPRLVLVQGDTTTAFCGALAAFYARLSCAHVEAGLRSGRRDAPWPEELNRQLCDRLCTRHYAPTAGARDNLLREGIGAADIVVTGQTGVDAALWMAERLAQTPPPELAAVAPGADQRLIFATGHRRESLDGGLAHVAAALARIADEFADISVIYPAHPNPAVRRQLAGLIGHKHVQVIGPVSYGASIWLMRRADVIVSDSGGIQEEAPSFGTPVIVTRDVTERPEGLSAGFLRIAGTDTAAVAAALREVLADGGLKARLKTIVNPYGDGQAGQRIAADVAARLR